ncbi:MAG: serine hydrolase [Chloroflexi bacterium]|nr:serine hydrolase [Chloroflexota bacterium]
MNLTRVCWLAVLLLLGAVPLAVLVPSAGAPLAAAIQSLRAVASVPQQPAGPAATATGAAQPAASARANHPPVAAGSGAPTSGPAGASAGAAPRPDPPAGEGTWPAPSADDRAQDPADAPADRAPVPTCAPLAEPSEPAADEPRTARSGAGRAAGPLPPALRPLPLRWHARLAEAVYETLGAASADYAVVVKRVSDGCGVALSRDRVFYAASLYKLVLLYDVFYQRERGELRFDEEIVVTEEHASYALGPLLWPVESAVTIADLAEAMITQSDNVAAIMLHKRLGGWATNQRLAAAGLRHTQLTTELPTTAGDLALVLEGLARGQAVSSRASQEMLALLRGQKVNDRIPAGLPQGVPVAHKTGNWENACHDAGVVLAPQGAYVLVVLSEETACAPRVAKLSAAVYEVLAADALQGHFGAP